MFREYDGFDRDTDGDDSLALDKGYFCHELQQRCEDLETAINTISSVLAHRHQDDDSMPDPAATENEDTEDDDYDTNSTSNLTLQSLDPVDGHHPNQRVAEHILRNQLLEQKFENERLVQSLKRLEEWGNGNLVRLQTIGTSYNTFDGEWVVEPS